MNNLKIKLNNFKFFCATHLSSTNMPKILNILVEIGLKNCIIDTLYAAELMVTVTFHAESEFREFSISVAFLEISSNCKNCESEFESPVTMAKIDFAWQGVPTGELRKRYIVKREALFEIPIRIENYR